MPQLDPALMRALVALSEAFDAINTTVRHEAEHRSGQADVPTPEVSVLRVLLRSPGLTLVELAGAIEQPIAETRKSIRDLLARGLVASSTAGGRAEAYVATAASAALRTAARERAAQHLRYALASLPTHDLAELARVAESINGLAASLGFRDVHPTYREE